MKFEILWLGGTMLICIIAMLIESFTNKYFGFGISMIAVFWFFAFIIYNDKKRTSIR